MPKLETPDRQTQLLYFMLMIVGGCLAVVGWMRWASL
jgi:hypothetical protein